MPRKGKGERETPIDLPLLVQSAYPHLPENQRKVADVLLDRIREVPFLSVIELEDLSGTSKATVVRLAQSLGFSGYHELRERLREGAQSEISDAGTTGLASPAFTLDVTPMLPAVEGLGLAILAAALAAAGARRARRRSSAR